MSRIFLRAIIVLILSPVLTVEAVAPSSNAIRSTVLIVNYDEDGEFLGWGSGFFVDEGIVVTNKHVIMDAAIYRVYAANGEGAYDTSCYRQLTKSDIKINLDDDVAYLRAYLDCPHGMMDFGPDPWEGEELAVIGFPYTGSEIEMRISTGSVTGRLDDGWLSTDAYLDVGNSGGPVTDGEKVLGVAVAKGIDSDGNFLEGYFIPASVILDGLLYANDPRFGYVPRDLPSSRSSISSSRRSSSISSTSSSSRSSSSRSSVRSSSNRSSRSSSSQSSASIFPDVSTRRPSFEAINELVERGVISGYPDGFFRPLGEINRAEFLKMLIGGFRPGAILGETSCFPDVGREWFAVYVCAGKRLGWIEGYPDGTFRPAATINRAEALKIIITAFGRRVDASDNALPADVPAGVWYEQYVRAGMDIGIVSPTALFRPAHNLIREDSAVWIVEAE